MRLGSMRTGISIHVTASDRERLFAIVADRNSLQKHVWRARGHKVPAAPGVVGTVNVLWAGALAQIP